MRERLLKKLPAERMHDAIHRWARDLPIQTLAQAIGRIGKRYGVETFMWAELMEARKFVMPMSEALNSCPAITSPAPAPRLVVIGHAFSISKLVTTYRPIAPDTLRRLLPWLTLARAAAGRYVLAYCRLGEPRPLVPLSEALRAYLLEDKPIVAFDLPVDSAPQLLNLEELPRYKVLSEISAQLLTPGIRLALQLQEIEKQTTVQPGFMTGWDEPGRQGRAQP